MALNSRKRNEQRRLKKATNITSNIFYRMSKNSYVNLESLEKICSALDCRVVDVIEMRRNKVGKSFTNQKS